MAKHLELACPHMKGAAAATTADMCVFKGQTRVVATHSGPCCHRKHHKGWEVAAGEVQNLLAYSHDLGLGFICAEALIVQHAFASGLPELICYQAGATICKSFQLQAHLFARHRHSYGAQACELQGTQKMQK